jgi:hypothetical protein
VVGDESAVDLARHLDALVIAVRKTEALAAVALESFDGASWRATDQLQIERFAYLFGTVAEAAAGASAALDRFRARFADQQPAETGDDWAR